MKFLVLLLLVLTIDCANIPEEDRLERRHELEDQLILAREEFERRTVSCRMAGGTMVIDRHSREITEHGYRMARCAE